MYTRPIAGRRAKPPTGPSATTQSSTALRNPGVERNTDAWSAVALQQHLVFGTRPSRPKLPPNLQRLMKRSEKSASQSTRRSRTAGGTGGWVGEECSQNRNSLTLSQRLGLVACPAPPLSSDEWEKVRERARERGDTESDCMICLEPFGASDGGQVLLSCTHTFHRVCLSSFERHSGVKSCPACRSQVYRKRLIEDGRRAHERKCARKIISVMRMAGPRKRFLAHMETAGPRDPSKRREWNANRVSAVADRFEREADEGCDRVDAFLAAIDAATRESKNVLEDGGVDAYIASRTGGQQQQQQQHNQDNNSNHSNHSNHSYHNHSGLDITSDARSSSASYVPTVIERSGAGNGGRGGRVTRRPNRNAADRKNDAIEEEQPPVPTEAEWVGIKRKAAERDTHDCVICLSSLTDARRGAAVLSCSHVFHAKCIGAFERFHVGAPRCPVCRSTYAKHLC